MYSNSIIRQNKAKVFLYMAIMTAFIGILGHFVSTYFNFGLTGTGIFLIIAGIMDFVAYFFSDVFVIKSSGAKEIKEEQMPEYFKLVRDMCERNNIKMPKLYLINTAAMNAFATGRNKDRAVVAVTRGLLEKLTPEEISGVVGHELSHIEHGDMFLMSVLSILAGFVSILADAFWRGSLFGRSSDRDRSGIVMLIGLALAIFAPITASLIKLAVSRSREYMADAKGAQICGNPLYLASALNKIKNDMVPLPNAGQATAHLYISNPFKGDVFSRLMSTHPDTDDRIRKLENMNINDKGI
ncbi:M48 family metalloprotease [bacterium]|nr:M48 family metalloprotease [bacterium]